MGLTVVRIRIQILDSGDKVASREQIIDYECLFATTLKTENTNPPMLTLPTHLWGKMPFLIKPNSRP